MLDFLGCAEMVRGNGSVVIEQVLPRQPLEALLVIQDTSSAAGSSEVWHSLPFCQPFYLFFAVLYFHECCILYLIFGLTTTLK